MIICAWAFFQLSRKADRGTILKTIIHCIPWYLLIRVSYSLLNNQKLFTMKYILTFLGNYSRKNKKDKTILTCKFFPISCQVVIREHWRMLASNMQFTHIAWYISDKNMLGQTSLYECIICLHRFRLLVYCFSWSKDSKTTIQRD